MGIGYREREERKSDCNMAQRGLEVKKENKRSDKNFLVTQNEETHLWILWSFFAAAATMSGVVLDASAVASR